MPSALTAFALAACLVTFASAQAGVPSIGPDYYGSKHKECRLGVEHVEKFDGNIFRDAGNKLPRSTACKFDRWGTDWFNIVPIFYDEVVKNNLMSIPKDAGVAAIGGTVDEAGHMVTMASCYIALQGGSEASSFSISSFDYFCLDQDNRPANCTIKIRASQDSYYPEDWSMLPPKLANFTVTESTGYLPQTVELNPLLYSHLTYFSIEQDLSTPPDATLQDIIDLRKKRITIYLTQIQYRTYLCGRRTYNPALHGKMNDILRKEWPYCIDLPDLFINDDGPYDST